jgi:hypothetical protein
MITLKLTSPNMKRPEVSAAQKLLKAKGYYTGKIDSIYGEASARGTRSAKWDLGYQEKNINSNYDDLFHAYLTGTKKQSLMMKQRAKARRKKYVGATALEIAQQFIGVNEQPPKSNKVMFSNWYGITGPWCAMFVTYAFVGAKSKAWKQHERYAYCPYVLEDAKYNRNYLALVPANQAKSGDVVLFDWDNDGIADHIGIVNMAPMKATKFTTIEGNTSGTNPSDGGMVAHMTRNVSDVIGFVRVNN